MNNHIGKIFRILAFILAGTSFLTSQIVILGGDSKEEISIQSSSNWQPHNRNDSCNSTRSFDGSGLLYDDLDASRFLYQATLGSSYEDIKSLSGSSFKQWIDHQLTLANESMLKETRGVLDELIDWHYMTGGDSMDAPSYANWVTFQYAWWNQHMLGKDKLRQRVALALSEFLVISIESELQGFGDGLASYYDLLKEGAFGNYKDILTNVSLHPTMGFFLSHLNNPKTDTAENTRPDENYAREIMQLFSIGLHQLQEDGSHKKDSAGNSLPTYNQRDIKELARVFTGLGISKVVPNMYIDSAYFGLGIYLADMTAPMKMYERWHEPGEKVLFGSHVIPDGQNGMKDINDAIDILFNHPNVGPFVGKLLIQRLIKSNPSPSYVERITKVFNNDGSGVRGNMAAVIKAILLDPEARECEWMMEESNGQLREPLVRYSHFTKAIDVEQYYGRYWNTGYEFWTGTGHLPLAAPSVFNFFSPFYRPKGPLDQMGLIGPEFQIHNSRTSIGYINQVNNWAVHNYVMNSWEDDDPYAILNLIELKELAQDPEVLVNRLDLLLTHGNLSDRTRNITKQAIANFKYSDYREDRVRIAIYLIMISPDYAIFK